MSDKRAPRRPAPEPGRMAAKVPQIMQMEALECGAASLAMVCAYWGKWLPLEQVRLDCGVSRDGSSALNVVKAARSYGLEAKGYRYEPETLREKATFPCVVHWNFNHFVVVRGFRGKHVYLNDPARGEVRVGLEEFDRSFTGVCLQFAPGPSFEPGGKPASIRSFALGRLRGTAAALLFVALTAVITAVINAVNPVFSQVLTDRLLGGRNPDWLVPFIAALAVVGAVQVVVAVLNARYLLRVEGKMAVAANSSFIWKLLHLPMEFYSQRSAGDISSRAASNTQVASRLVGELAPLAINFAMLVFYLVVMLGYSPLLSAIGVASTVANLVLARIISQKRVNVVRVQMRDEANLSAATVAGIDMVETIRAAGAEDGYFQRWSGYQAGANNQQVSYARLNAYLGLVPQLVTGAANVAVLMVGVWLVLRGSFTVGMILAFQGFLSQFSAPAQSLINTMQTFFEMRTDMERIQDVMDYAEDPLAADGRSAAPADSAAGTLAGAPAAGEGGAPATPASASAASSTPATSGMPASLATPAAPAPAAALVPGTPAVSEHASYEKLRGEVEMRGVTFGYSRLARPLVEGFDLHVPAGGSVAFVGPSGCGKSTIAKLLTGLYRPWAGEVLLDGTPLADIPRPVRTGSVAVVDQDIVLFEGSIEENVSLWDSSIEDYEVILAARDAQLHDDIMARPGGYAAKLAAGGTDMSGGQRQRLEIARALAADPTILVLDEATSALDAVTEHEVMQRIRRRGITLVVVAHRLSTIRDCDQIIVLDRGKVVQCGTHDELMEQGGLYVTLVTKG